MSDPAAIDPIIPTVEQFMGTPGVSMSEIQGVLSQAGKALEMIRGSSFADNLSNIAYIYNSTESGAFGIFDPNLDRAVKVKIVEKKLEGMGYSTKFENGNLYAWAPNKSPEEVTSQMEGLYEDLEIKGGVVIGINAANILDVARRNFSQLQQGGEPVDSEDFDTLVALHLGSTIVHETVHALGAEDEGAPVAAQQAWTTEVLAKINAERAARGKGPLEISGDTYRARSFKQFVKEAQVSYQEYVLPEAFLRMNYWYDQALFPVDGNPNDSVETLLEKNSHNPIPADFILERELQKDRQDPLSQRMLLEDLLDEERIHPIILPVKSAGINSNIGGPFISSAFSIDELLPRVFDGRDITDRIDYKEGEDPYWHRRYNPQNIKWERNKWGDLTYQYDYRFRYVDYDTNNPMSWNELFREDGVTGPWRKMASSGDDAKNDIVSLLRSVGYYKNLVREGRRNAARFICSPEMSRYVARAACDMDLVLFDHGAKHVVWIRREDVPEEKILQVERAIIQGTDTEFVNEFMGTAEDIKDRVNSILQHLRTIASEHGIKQVYVVGGFARTLAGDKNFLDVNDLDFTSPTPTECLKIGGLLASEIHADDMSIFHRTMTMSFSHLGIKMDFRGNFVDYEIRQLLREAGIPSTALNFDVYARDFTVNSLLYDFVENKIYDVTGEGVRDIERNLVRTYFSPERVIPGNPLIITRAIVMNLRGWELDPHLVDTMKEHSSLLFSGKTSEIRLAYECGKILGYEDGEYMLKEFGLEKLKEIREKAERENPELFEDED